MTHEPIVIVIVMEVQRLPLEISRTPKGNVNKNRSGP